MHRDAGDAEPAPVRRIIITAFWTACATQDARNGENVRPPAHGYLRDVTFSPR